MAAIAVFGLFSVVAGAQLPRVEPAYRPAALGVQHSEKPPRLFAAKSQPVVTLDALTPSRPAPDVVGTVRYLPATERVSDGIRTFRSFGATRVRLHLKTAAGVMWVAGADGKAIAFGDELKSPDGDLWTPSVAGDTISIQTSGGASSVVDAIGHLQPVADSTACFKSASCASFPDKTSLSAAIGQMTFQRGNSLYACSGGLINSDSGGLYFLTANHCISTASEAASLELQWDDGDSSCGANDAATRVKRTNGATLVTTSATSDVTLLRLASIPAGRWFLGWDTNPPAVGTVLRRISHPLSDSGQLFAQIYTATTVYAVRRSVRLRGRNSSTRRSSREARPAAAPALPSSSTAATSSGSCTADAARIPTTAAPAA
jgi:hypothetical protein